MDEFHKNLEQLNDIYEKMKLDNEALNKENEKLKDMHYKDKIIQKLLEIQTDLQKQIHHYGMTDKIFNALESWINKHNKENHKDNINYHYEIQETEIMTCYTVRCNICNQYHNEFW